MVAALPWAAEFILELIGARLALRRRNWILFALFAFCALSDIAIFEVGRWFGFATIYAWSYWAQRTGKSVLLIILACCIVGKMVKEIHAGTVRLVSAAVTILGSAFVVKAFSDGETLRDRLQDAAMAGTLFMLVIVAVGFISRCAYLRGTSKLTAIAFLVQVLSDIAITAAWTQWDAAKHFYPMGTIPAYLIWCWSLLKKEEAPVSGEARLGIGTRTPALRLEIGARGFGR